MFIETKRLSNFVKQFGDISGKNTSDNGVLRDWIPKGKVLFFWNVFVAFYQILLVDELRWVRSILQNNSFKDFLFFDFRLAFADRNLILIFSSHTNWQRSNGYFELVYRFFNFVFLYKKVSQNIQHHLDQLLGLNLIKRIQNS